MNDQRSEISDLEELVALIELLDVVFHEVSGKRTDEQSEDPDALEISAMWRRDAEKLATRFRATVRGEGGEFVADAEAIFSLAEDREVGEDVVQSFLERVGIMVVYPYLRAAVAESATKLSLPRPVLKLIRANEVQFSK